MKKLILFALSISFLLIILESCRVFKKDIPLTYTAENILIDYGEVIYQREQCSSCHTQHIDQESETLVSLDGLSDKYSNSWLYRYFDAPKLLNFRATKSAYPQLYYTPLRQENVPLILNSKSQVAASGVDILWDSLLIQANRLTASLPDRGIPAVENPEVVALIAYLQQIPPSESMMRLDSLKEVAKTERFSEWESVLLDSNSVVFQIAKDERYLEKGQLLFRIYCAVCHGQAGEGGIGSNLTDEYWLHGGSPSDIVKTIALGVPEKGMLRWSYQLSQEEVGSLAAFITSLQGTNPENPKAPQGTRG